jgi:class 3 adenylate cyclase
MLSEQRKLATYMFTDMVGYSALAQKNEFASAVDATRCAVEIQQTLASRNAVTPAEESNRQFVHISEVRFVPNSADGWQLSSLAYGSFGSRLCGNTFAVTGGRVCVCWRVPSMDG